MSRHAIRVARRYILAQAVVVPIDPDTFIVRIFDRRDVEKRMPGDHLDLGWIASQIQAYWGSINAVQTPKSIAEYAEMVSDELGVVLARPKMISVKPNSHGLAIELTADDENGRHFTYSFGVSLRPGA